MSNIFYNMDFYINCFVFVVISLFFAPLLIKIHKIRYGLENNNVVVPVYNLYVLGKCLINKVFGILFVIFGICIVLFSTYNFVRYCYLIVYIGLLIYGFIIVIKKKYIGKHSDIIGIFITTVLGILLIGDIAYNYVYINYSANRDMNREPTKKYLENKVNEYLRNFDYVNYQLEDSSSCMAYTIFITPIPGCYEYKYTVTLRNGEICELTYKTKYDEHSNDETFYGCENEGLEY